MGSTDEQFCLRWNDFQTCIKSTFQGLREEKEFMDVTISCDGEQVTAHKVILSACSVTFRQILMKNPAPHPVILLWVSFEQELQFKQLELQWRQAPPCSSWDTGREAPLIFSPGFKSLS